MPRATRAQDLWSQDATVVSAAGEKLGAELIERLRRALPSARRGNPTAIRTYVRTWRLLEARLLDAFHELAPELVVESGGRLLLADVTGRPSASLTELLDQEALQAPFSIWVQAMGDGPGVAVHLIAAIRRFSGRALLPLPGHVAEPLLFADASPSLDPAGFLRLGTRELEAEPSSLERVAELFRLSDTDVARLFGVSRQRVAQWRDEGVPAAHHSKLTTIARIADQYERNLLGDRIPGVVRTPAGALGGRTLLQAIADGDGESALRLIEDSFDWSRTA